jgi:hypothetical protein
MNPDQHACEATDTTDAAPRQRRRRRFRGKVFVAAAIVIASLASATVAYASTRGGRSELERIRKANSQYRDLEKATKAGFGELIDVNGIACIDMPGMGAMGVHYVNGGLVADGAIDPRTPEAMVYEPDAKGRLKLVAVEYVVFKDAWDAMHSAPPSLFGHTFDTTANPNRFGLPAFYSLHAWLYKNNPAGTFSMWNPKVTCDPGSGHSGHDGHGGDDGHSGHDH